MKINKTCFSHISKRTIVNKYKIDKVRSFLYSKTHTHTIALYRLYKKQTGNIYILVLLKPDAIY